ncbi:MAG: NADH:flavin oxidoreductase/NADH oxidase [Actinomycetes bacterium]|jgi:2,4-dienoyl-CoA reductase-like NADH-dependent reductase (Old Yellow Enzyme family)
MTSALFSPLTLRDMTFPNRVWVSPMCQYSAVDGIPEPWHLVHLGALATGRPGLLITEATAVTPEGRISPLDLGLWSDSHAEALIPIVSFAHGQDVPIAIQLAHAGRKASTSQPSAGGGSLSVEEGGWITLAPSAEAFGEFAEPVAMTLADCERTRDAFVAAAIRADAIGVDVVEIHAAHGYLLHEFLSPLSNLRDDQYGGDLASRMRYPLEIVAAVREAWPSSKPLFVRISATDWAPGGWDIESSVIFARESRIRGVDLIDVSSGGLAAHQQVAVSPGYQVPFAAQIRTQADMPTAAVGLITEAKQAEQIVESGSADAVLLGRAVLREPRWPLHAAAELDADHAWPHQLARARVR